MTSETDPHSAHLLDGIVTAMNPEAVSPFGGRARGDARPDSDDDLLVILPDEATPEQLLWRTPGQVRRGPSVSADIIPCRRRHFEERRDAIGTVGDSAANEGRLGYGH